jgi:hypothetical protein
MSRTLEIGGIEITPNGTPCNVVELIKQPKDGTIVIGYLVQDEDCSNPCEDCDGMGHVRSLSSRHINNIGVDEATELLKTDNMVVTLSYFEHGRCVWDVQGGSQFGSCPDRQWDGVPFAGVWVPDQCCRDEIKSRSHSKHITYQQAAKELAAECCREYTSWVNGDCYGIVTERFDDAGNFIKDDSCWGHIGSEYAEQALKEQFDGETEDELATANAI